MVWVVISPVVQRAVVAIDYWQVLPGKRIRFS